MIAKTTGFKVGDKMFATLEEAQRAELLVLFPPWEGGVGYTPEGVVNTLFAKADEVLNVLTLTPRSKPKARKHAGTTNPKRAAKAASPAVVQSGLTLMREAVDGQAE